MASRRHILVVEDEPLVMELLMAVLEEFYRVSSAGTVGDACAFLRTSDVDLVLVDWSLPDGHGDSVATYAETRSIAAIMMSGYASGMDEVKNHWCPVRCCLASGGSASDKGFRPISGGVDLN
jgi:DNA-binding response OmpR family regulator